MADKYPNIVLIIADCLRTDVAFDTRTMPFLNALAGCSGGFRQRVYTHAPNTFFSVPSILTGNLPFKKTNRAGINADISRDYLPSILRGELNYRTIGITANVVTSSFYGYDLDFDYYDDFPNVDFGQTSAGEYHKKLRNLVKSKFPNYVVEMLRTIKKYWRLVVPQKSQNTSISSKIRGFDVVESYNRALSEREDEPVFVFIHLMETHRPYAPVNLKSHRRARYLSRKLDVFPDKNRFTSVELSEMFNLYRQEARDLDSYIKDVWYTTLESLGMENLVFLVVADHGECFFETDYLTHPSDKLYNVYGQLTVPLFLFSSRSQLRNQGWNWTSDVYRNLMQMSNRKTNRIPEVIMGYSKESPQQKGTYQVEAILEPAEKRLMTNRNARFLPKLKDIAFKQFVRRRLYEIRHDLKLGSAPEKKPYVE